MARGLRRGRGAVALIEPPELEEFGHESSVPKKSLDFFDKDMLLVFASERFLVDHARRRSECVLESEVLAGSVEVGSAPETVPTRAFAVLGVNRWTSKNSIKPSSSIRSSK
jgi:hypothetical protein